MSQPDAAIVYSDDDVLDQVGPPCHPRFKPDWSLAHVRSTHYIGDAVVAHGCADHLHADLPRNCAGWCQRAVIAQELSAVTAACILTCKSLYEKLGGLDEKNLPVAFNDVDYCLRLGRLDSG